MEIDVVPPGGLVQDLSSENLRWGLSKGAGKDGGWELDFVGTASVSGFSLNWSNPSVSITFLGYKSTFSGISNLEIGSPAPV